MGETRVCLDWKIWEGEKEYIFTSSKIMILPEHELVVNSLSRELIYWHKSRIGKSITPLRLQSTFDKQFSFWFANDFLAIFVYDEERQELREITLSDSEKWFRFFKTNSIYKLLVYIIILCVGQGYLLLYFHIWELCNIVLWTLQFYQISYSTQVVCKEKAYIHLFKNAFQNVISPLNVIVK